MLHHVVIIVVVVAVVVVVVVVVVVGAAAAAAAVVFSSSSSSCGCDGNEVRYICMSDCWIQTADRSPPIGTHQPKRLQTLSVLQRVVL